MLSSIDYSFEREYSLQNRPSMTSSGQCLRNQLRIPSAVSEQMQVSPPACNTTFKSMSVAGANEPMKFTTLHYYNTYLPHKMAIAI